MCEGRGHSILGRRVLACGKMNSTSGLFTVGPHLANHAQNVVMEETVVARIAMPRDTHDVEGGSVAAITAAGSRPRLLRRLLGEWVRMAVRSQSALSSARPSNWGYWLLLEINYWLH